MTEVVNYGILHMQVCVPKSWADDLVVDFAEAEYSAGTRNGWQIAKPEDGLLNGDPERAQCDMHGDHCHVVLIV